MSRWIAASPVRVERTGLRTLAEGTGDSTLLRLANLPNSADVVPGDKLVTSGLGDVFPSGRPVAIITEFRQQPEQSFAFVTARPVSNLDRDQEVLLVWNNKHDRADGQTDEHASMQATDQAEALQGALQ